MANKCSDLNNLYDDVQFCPGQKTLPGVRDHFYFIRKKDIVAWPTLPLNTADSLEKVATYTGQFTLAADRKFLKVDLVPSESEPTSERTGAYGSYHFLNKITLVLPGSGQKVTGLITELANDDVVIIVPQRNGQCRVFGNEMFTVSVNPSQAWGKGSDDANTTTIEIEVEDWAATPFFEGTIPTAEGNVSGQTDTVAPAAGE